MLTDKQIEDIALKYTRWCGGYWEHEEAIPDRYVIDFARDIEKAVLFDGVVEPQRENTELQELLKDKARLDWLADVNQNIGNVILPRDIVERNLHSIRAAIDEAMKK